jgi:uncharacterized RDD family membrane protein YckC
MAELALPNQKKTGFLGMPKLPVAGLFIRLIALIIDLVLIVSAIHLMVRTIPGFFWSIDILSKYFTGIATFLYFVLLNGPVGKGQTVGKMIFRIRTTDQEGNAPSLTQSVQRTLILFPVFVLGPLATVIWGIPESVYESYFSSYLTHFPMISILLATLMVVPFNPFKQGLHDYYAQTLVRPLGQQDQPCVTFSDMIDKVGLSWPKMYRQPQYAGLITFSLVFLLFAYMGYPGRASSTYLERSEKLHQLNKMSGLENALVRANPIPEAYFVRTPLYLNNIDQFPLLGDDQETTGTRTLILQITHAGDWKKTWDENKMKLTSELLARSYHENIFPLTIKLLKETVNGDADDTDQQKGDYLNQLAAEWENNEIDLMLLYMSELSIPPYPAPLEKIVYHDIKSFPPLVEKKVK